MALWKIVGFECAPPPPLSIMPLRVPFPVSSRESESIHTLRLTSASFHNRSFMALSRLRYPRPEGCPTPNESLHRLDYGIINKSPASSKRNQWSSAHPARDILSAGPFHTCSSAKVTKGCRIRGG